MKIKRSAAEQTGYAIIVTLLVLFAFSTLYPFWHVLMYSVSDSGEAMSGGLFFLPRKPTLLAYRTVLRTRQIFVAYRNTILKTFVGTLLSLVVTALTAFPLSLKRLHGRSFFSMYIFFTMLFGGGMIPTYLAVSQAGLIDSMWALILPNLVSAYNVVLMRNYIDGLPEALLESAMIDGASQMRTLFSIVLPLMLPSLATIGLFCAVGYWNTFFNALLYINRRDMATLQIYLREVLVNTQNAEMNAGMDELYEGMQTECVQGACVVASSLPIILVYPFLQKYYVKGMTLGAVKG